MHLCSYIVHTYWNIPLNDMDLTCLDLAYNICMCCLYWLFPILAKLLITFDHDLELIVACLYNLCLILIEYWEQYAQLHWSCCLLDPLVPEWYVQYAEYRSLHAWIWPETEGHVHLDWHCLCSDSNMIPPDTTLILHLTMHDPPDLCLHVIYWYWDIMTVWLALVLDVLPCAYMTWQHNIPKMLFIINLLLCLSCSCIMKNCLIMLLHLILVYCLYTTSILLIIRFDPELTHADPD